MWVRLIAFLTGVINGGHSNFIDFINLVAAVYSSGEGMLSDELVDRVVTLILE